MIVEIIAFSMMSFIALLLIHAGMFLIAMILQDITKYKTEGRFLEDVTEKSGKFILRMIGALIVIPVRLLMSVCIKKEKDNGN